jgi:hypothetical protein
MSDHAVQIAPQPAYWYRRSLRPLELLPAVGAAVGAGLAAFYLARLFLERTPLTGPDAMRRPARPATRRSARHADVRRAVARR